MISLEQLSLAEFSGESPKKRAAAKEQYKQHTPEKRATMALYNERHREKINDAMREQYQKDPAKKKDKSDTYYATRSQYGSQKCPECDRIFFMPKDMKQHIDNIHSLENVVTCQICDKQINKESLGRHMREVHGGEKHRCEKCPAAFSRHSDLKEHMKEGWHYLSYHCKQCDKTIVFKNLGGLVEHTIVKQSREERISKIDGAKYEVCKSGILVACQSHLKSTQLKEGKDIMTLTRGEKVKAMKERTLKKEEILNDGLQLAMKKSEAPIVKVEFEYKKHEDDGRRKCKWCWEHIPFSNEYCLDRKPDTNWSLQRESK